MFHCLYKRFLISIHTLQIQSLQNQLLRSYCETSQPVSLFQYLKNSCGLSREKALTASKRLQHRPPENTDSVLTFLKSNGFSKTHITAIITKAPQILFADVDFVLQPNIQFFKEKGLSESEIVDLLVSNPGMFTASLEDRIKPSFNFFRSLLGSAEFAVESLKRLKKFRMNLNEAIASNVEVLMDCGVPKERISKLHMKHPLVLMLNSERFRENVKMVKEMGFNPSTHIFLEAVRVMSCLSPPMWKMKFEVYRSVGWSDKETLLAFRKHPSCITLSEEKIRKGMDFFVKEMGWSPSSVLANPVLLSLSLEKRVKARYNFLQVLISKGLIREDKKFSGSFRLGNEQFFKDYVMKYEAEFPEILEVYKGMIESGHLGFKDGEDYEDPDHVWATVDGVDRVGIGAGTRCRGCPLWGLQCTAVHLKLAF